jgi:hypothetical protein
MMMFGFFGFFGKIEQSLLMPQKVRQCMGGSD